MSQVPSDNQTDATRPAVNPEKKGTMVDADSDGATNLDEYRAGTDPHNAASKLALELAAVSSTQATLRLTAAANKSYTLQYRNLLGSGSWQNLVNLPAEGAVHTVTHLDPLPPGLGSRFYRVVSPSQ